MRAVNDRFRNDLKDGILAQLRRAVISDPSLCLELRGSYINVYYRGGNLLKVQQLSEGYDIHFDKNYFTNKNSVQFPESKVLRRIDVDEWIEFSAKLKQAIDRHFGKQRNDEREVQQVLLRENNFGKTARQTDYYICDIEYQRMASAPRFDAIAVHWPSKSQVRRQAANRRLVIIEMKYGDSALKDKAGLHAHLADVKKFLGRPGNVKDLKEDMVEVFNQKRELGLIDCGKDLDSFSDTPPVVLLVLANHDPDSSILRDVLKTLPECPNAEVRIATASFFGYGLYDQGVHTVDETFQRFGDYIHSRAANTI